MNYFSRFTTRNLLFFTLTNLPTILGDQLLKPDDDPKIVIIGAGTAGLMAANKLKSMGFDDYIVLEASDRIGGRLKMVEDFHDEVPLDLGAEWIHSPNGQEVVNDMLLFNVDDDDMSSLDSSEFIEYRPDWYFRCHEWRFIKCLYQETKWKRLTWWHWLDTHVHRHVADKVYLESPVTKIVYSDDKSQVQVTTETGEVYHTEKVICTMPLGVLKSGLVDFQPLLPDSKLKAIEDSSMPPGFRIFFEMKKKFYPDLTVNNSLLWQLFDGDDLAMIYDALYGKDGDENWNSTMNVLGYVAVGPKNGAEFDGLIDADDDDGLAKAVLAKIDEIFDGQGSENYVKHVVQRWTTEPYILGTYTFSPKFGVINALRETIGGGNILFAGEHTSENQYSMVTGAAYEGQRAASEAFLSLSS